MLKDQQADWSMTTGFSGPKVLGNFEKQAPASSPWPGNPKQTSSWPSTLTRSYWKKRKKEKKTCITWILACIGLITSDYAMCFKLFHLHDTALQSNIWCFPQINLGVSDFRMLMMVINDNLLEGRGGELWPIFLLYIEHSIKTLSTFTACWYLHGPFILYVLFYAERQGAPKSSEPLPPDEDLKSITAG